MRFTGRWWGRKDRNRGINSYSIMITHIDLRISKYCPGKCSKLSQTCPSYSIISCALLAIAPKGQVAWMFLKQSLGDTCSNHSDVTTRVVTLNCSHTFHKNVQYPLSFQGNISRYIKMFWEDGVWNIQVVHKGQLSDCKQHQCYTWYLLS